jgi:AraC-like DNA-binding protein
LLGYNHSKGRNLPDSFTKQPLIVRSAEAASPHRDTSIEVAHYNSETGHPEHHHEDWASRGWPSVAALFDSTPLERFSTMADRVNFDGLVLQYSYGTARDFDRKNNKARSDGIDILGVGVQFDNELRGRTSNGAFNAPAGALLLLDMAQPSSVRVPEGRSMQLALPRHIADEHLGSVRKLHGIVVQPDKARMLVGHLLHVRESLPNLIEAQEPRLARTVIDMLAIALDSTAMGLPRQLVDNEPSAAARRAIDARLGLASLTVPSLCASLRMSRSALYRIFESDGGVEAYIRTQRLEKVRAALADPAGNVRIGELAYRWGFSDASHMTRQFREAYGCTPSAYRSHSRRPNG